MPTIRSGVGWRLSPWCDVLRGETKNIILPPQTSSIAAAEAFLPTHIELRNGHLTEAGNWRRRPGYVPKWDLGVKEPVHALIPYGNGYAVTQAGLVFELKASGPVRLSGRLTGSRRPTWANDNGTLILADGGVPMFVDGAELKPLEPAASVTPLGGYPPPGKFVSTLDSYVLLAGQHPTDWNYSAVNNRASWPLENSNAVLREGEKIEALRVFKREAYFFKSRSIEIWINIGGDQVFARTRGLIARGTKAGASVVQANDTFYWLGDDGDFYELSGPKNISFQHIRDTLDTIKTQADCYGFDCRAEAAIRWCFPTDGRCLVYDYAHNLWSEDSVWAEGNQMLPMASYMELGGEQLFGDTAATGLIYRLSREESQDNGRPVRVVRRFRVQLTPDGTDARVHRLRLRCQRGEGRGTVSPRALVAWRMDDGEWTVPAESDLGQLGDREPYVDLDQLGVGREMEIELVETDAVTWLVTDGFLTVERLGR